MTDVMFEIANYAEEPAFLSTNEQNRRAKRIADTLDMAAIRSVGERLRSYTAGTLEIDGLSLYHELEKSTSLLLFHCIPREGARNRCHNGLQQTYGDHIRIMMFALDKLERNDRDWYLSRRSQDEDLDKDALERCMSAYNQLGLDRQEKCALWVAACLHDFGKLYHRGYGLDAEDAVPLVAPIIDQLCEQSLKELVKFVVRNHDLIEHVINGGTPPQFIRRQTETLPEETRRLAIPFLGLIQLAGAASLGEGRVTRRKIRIYEECVSGTITQVEDVETRVVRLVEGKEFDLPQASIDHVKGWLAHNDSGMRDTVKEFMENVVLYGWKRVAGRETTRDGRLRALVDVVRTWDRCGQEHTHVVIAEGGLDNGDTKTDGAEAAKRDVVLLNGSRALILG